MENPFINSASETNVPTHYELRIQGHLAAHWENWFQGITIEHEADGNSVLRGEFIDQAALHAVLRRVRDAGMVLLSVNRMHANSTKKE